jgi:hypothetical protein
MSERGSSMRDLPSALTDGEALNERFAGTLEDEACGGFDAFLERVMCRVRDRAGGIDGF